MNPDLPNSSTDISPAAHGSASAGPPHPAQPGQIAGIASIVAGVIGFTIPVLGVLVACIGIGFGVAAFRRGRRANARLSYICGLIGCVVSLLSIAFWVSAVLFESYH